MFQVLVPRNKLISIPCTFFCKFWGAHELLFQIGWGGFNHGVIGRSRFTVPPAAEPGWDVVLLGWFIVILVAAFIPLWCCNGVCRLGQYCLLDIVNVRGERYVETALLTRSYLSIPSLLLKALLRLHYTIIATIESHFQGIRLIAISLAALELRWVFDLVALTWPMKILCRMLLWAELVVQRAGLNW